MRYWLNTSKRGEHDVAHLIKSGKVRSLRHLVRDFKNDNVRKVSDSRPNTSRCRGCSKDLQPLKATLKRLLLFRIYIKFILIIYLV